MVLCAYLGQLARVRDALSTEMTVVMDERDQAQLEDLEGSDAEMHCETVQVSKRVRLCIYYITPHFSNELIP